MKKRFDFITNSSSSSFIIKKKYLDYQQIEAVKKHRILATKLGMDMDGYCTWDIEENSDFITGYTYMDNFSMSEFLDKIGVPDKVVSWDISPYDISYDYSIDKSGKNWRELLNEI